jgi:hypothetical protein
MFIPCFFFCKAGVSTQDSSLEFVYFLADKVYAAEFWLLSGQI